MRRLNIDEKESLKAWQGYLLALIEESSVDTSEPIEVQKHVLHASKPTPRSGSSTTSQALPPANLPPFTSKLQNAFWNTSDGTKSAPGAVT